MTIKMNFDETEKKNRWRGTVKLRVNTKILDKGGIKEIKLGFGWGTVKLGLAHFQYIHSILKT